jgi:hypothetical protein
VLGLSASTVGMLVSACGDEGEPTADTVSVPPMDQTKPAEITLYN